MISWSASWNRIRHLSAFQTMSEPDFRPLIYAQSFSVAAGQTTSATPQQFAGGAIVLGITSSAYKDGQALASGQAFNNRQNYGLNFSYTNNETLTPGGPVIAEALLGGGEDTLFPPRELIVAPNQQILTQAQNFTSDALIIQVVYHCMIFRFAS